MIAVTGASGALGRLVIERLLGTEAPSSIRALARSPEKIADLAARGVEVAMGRLTPGLAARALIDQFT